MKHICSALKRNSDQNGFTLVELIVVIAILAILSAIAYPVYTGYITKANEAADLTLLGHVNESFVSALLDDGYYDGLPDAAQASFAADNTLDVSSVSYAKPTAEGGTKDTSLETLFAKYYAGNEKTKFKVYTKLGYDAALGGFYGEMSDGTKILGNGWKIKSEAAEEGYTNYTVTDDEGNEYTFKVKDASVAALNDSVFGIMGAASLVSEVGACSDGASYTFGQLSPQLLLSADVFAKFNQYISEHHLSKGMKEYDAAIANFVVMDVATLSKDLTASKAIDVIKGNDKLGTTTLGPKVTQAATAYGVLTAWAHDPAHKDDVIYGSYTAETLWNHLSEGLKSGDESQLGTIRTEVLGLAGKMSSSSNFNTYIDSTEGQKAIEAYIGAMGTLYDNTSTLGDFDVYAKGFNDEDLGAILSGVYGG